MPRRPTVTPKPAASRAAAPKGATSARKATASAPSPSSKPLAINTASPPPPLPGKAPPPPSSTNAHGAAAVHLAALHPQIHALRQSVGDPILQSEKRTAFESLARSIVFQQLAGAAAQTIWNRVLAVTGSPINPERLSRHDDETLRACGLSSAKLRALRDLAARASALKLTSIHRAPDDEIIARLTEVRGIGVWTAQMFLMFHLGRLDVWPTADLGVREGYRRMFRLATRPTEKELSSLGAPFQPYRSVAAWYMWRAVELLPP